MKHHKLLIAGVLMTASTVALAEPSEGFRLNTGVYLDEGDPLIGLGYEIPVSANASIIPGAEYVFVDNGSLMTFNVDSRFDLDVNSRNPMWAGIGMGALHREVGRFEDTDYGINLTWGMDFDRNQSWMPYLNTKVILSEESYFMVGFGIRFGRGGTAGAVSAD